MRGAALLVAGVLLLAGCGSEEGGSEQPARSTCTGRPTAATAKTAEPPQERHGITVTYDEPQNDAEATAKQILQLGGPDGVAEGFT